MTLPPAPNPCGSCPYRRDVPSGIWHRSEYLKLPLFDQDTADQPTYMLLCHQQDGRICAGWCATHDMENSLGLRLAAGLERISRRVLQEVLNYTTSVPLFSSGTEACAHGLAGIRNPSRKALSTMQTLLAKRKVKMSLTSLHLPKSSRAVRPSGRKGRVSTYAGQPRPSRPGRTNPK